MQDLSPFKVKFKRQANRLVDKIQIPAAVVTYFNKRLGKPIIHVGLRLTAFGDLGVGVEE